MSRRRRSSPLPTILGVVVVAGLIAVVSTPEEPVAPTRRALDLPVGRVRVEVLNGGGVTGMARRATRHLRDLGFDVVDFGNASSVDTARPSVVIDRIGRGDLARAVADGLGIDNVRIEPDPNLYVDVSVLLGSEWSVPSTEGHEPASRPRWDPRGWLNR